VRTSRGADSGGVRSNQYWMPSRSSIACTARCWLRAVSASRMAYPVAMPGTGGRKKPTTPAAMVNTASGHMRLKSTAPGSSSGRLVAVRAELSSREIPSLTRLPRPRKSPMARAANHQPAASRART